MTRPDGRALLLGVALLAGATATPASVKSDREALAAARPAGPPVDCVPINQIRETRVRSDRVIDFYMLGKTVYRNTLPNSCPQLGLERAISYRTSINQLCSVDIITVLNQSGGYRIPGPSCGLGTFQPVTGLKR